MREILFRAKRKDNGEWIYGSLIHVGDLFAIIEADYDDEDNLTLYLDEDTGLIDGHLTLVDSETVGQFTGLTDKNSNKIFEGDIVVEVYGEKEYKRYKVEFNPERCGWVPFACGDGCGCCESDVVPPSNSKVVGNIHDNPEMLDWSE